MANRSTIRSRDSSFKSHDGSSFDIEHQSRRTEHSPCADEVCHIASNSNGSGGAVGVNSDASDPETETSESARFATNPSLSSSKPSALSKTGLQVLVLLAFQNCTKNLLLRFVMKDKPQFLTSAAVIGVELVKLVLSLMYIILVDRKTLLSCVTYLREDSRNTMLMAVPAAAYSFQMTLEYVALSNIDAALFSVLVQIKLLATAGCSVLILGKHINKVQFISLMLLTSGVMLCNMKDFGKQTQSLLDDSHGKDPLMNPPDAAENAVLGGWIGGLISTDATSKGILATLGIAASSGFASVYTEKVIKAKHPGKATTFNKEAYGLAYTQVQLAVVSLVIMGMYCAFMEMNVILEKGLWYGFNGPAFLSIFVSAIGGLTVSAVLKFADAVLKGYATAVSVILTGVLSMVLFGTHLNTIYFMGIGNVVFAVLLYSGNNLDRNLC